MIDCHRALHIFGSFFEGKKQLLPKDFEVFIVQNV